jgi:hypothetical protein
VTSHGTSPLEPLLNARMELGHADCFGSTVPHDAFRWPTVVRVIGLYADGSEHDGGVIVAHRLGEIVQRPEVVFVQEDPTPPLFDERTVFAAADAERLRRMRLGALAVAGALVVVVVGFVRRRRRAAVW